MRHPLVPDSRAASMKVCPRRAMVPPRAIRPKAGTLKKDSAQITCSSLGPRPSAMTSARTSAGKAIAPTPGSEKIGSMIATAPTSVPRLSPTSVMSPNREFGSAWRSRMRQGFIPLARAVTM